MSKCPQCSNELKLAPCVFTNVEAYGNTSVASTECCGHAVTVSRKVQFNISPYNGSRTEDDWGNAIKKAIPQSEINDALALTAFTHFQSGDLNKGLDIIRGITNPLTAAWLVQDVMEQMGSSMSQTKNWLINALYNGK